MKKMTKTIITLSLAALITFGLAGCSTDVPESPTPDANSEPAAATQENSGQTSDSDFKATMDSYEAFFNEYVAFMEKYAASDGTDLSLLSDYSTYMSKYADVMAKLDALDTNSMTADELAYFTEVQARITQKIANIKY